jgi:hypothetical protein
MVPSYLAEVFVRSKAAWGGGAVIILVGVVEHSTGKSLSGPQYAIALLLAVIGAQFWHGLEERRGSTGTGYYFTVYNLSDSKPLESVKAELVEMTPDAIGILPAPLHVRHKDYCTSEISINPGASNQFDLATGPDHNPSAQSVMIIPYVMGGDRGYTMGKQVPNDRYRLRVRVSAKNCISQDVHFEVWIEDNFLRCIAIEQ